MSTNLVTDERILRFVTTTLSPPVLWVILLLLFAEWKLYRRERWNVLLVAWFCNIVYLYNESFAPNASFAGLSIPQFVAANLSLLTAVLFLAFALSTRTRPKSAFLFATMSGGAVIAVSLIIARFATGSWRAPFGNEAFTPRVSLAMYAPLVAFSALAAILCAIALRKQLKGAPRLIRRLIVGAWLLYGGLQVAYFLKFSGPKRYIVGVFVLAWFAKLSIAAGLFLLFKDDTEAMHARRVALQAQVRQQVAFSWFAHELKNPVHALHFRVATLSKRLDLKEYTRAQTDAAKILQTTTVLTSIVESVKLAAEPIDPTKLTYFSVNDAVTDALDQVKSAFQADARAMRAALGKGVRVCALRPALVQVFSNLLRNALEACAELSDAQLAQSSHAKVFVDTKRLAKYVRVRIVDYGIGISAEIQQSVFDPYYSTKHGINRGLGLWVVRTFVESFHGRVSVISPIPRLSRGTVFEILLPSASREDIAPERFFGNITLSEAT